MPNRRALAQNDSLAVLDWADAGPLYYGQRDEDGERPVLRPDREAVVELVTADGYVYHLSQSFGDDFAAAEAMVARIVAAGSVNLDRWTYARLVFLSPAFIAEGADAYWRSEERKAEGFLAEAR